MNNFKKLLSIMLITAMTVAALPVSIYADENTVQPEMQEISQDMAHNTFRDEVQNILQNEPKESTEILVKVSDSDANGIEQGCV